MERTKFKSIFAVCLIIFSILYFLGTLLYVCIGSQYCELFKAFTSGFYGYFALFFIIFFPILWIISAIAILKNKRWGRILLLIIFTIWILSIMFNAYTKASYWHDYQIRHIDSYVEGYVPQSIFSLFFKEMGLGYIWILVYIFVTYSWGIKNPMANFV